MRFVGLAVLFTVPLLAAPVPKAARPAFSGPNANGVLKAFQGRVQAEASSTWGGYDAAKLIDGDEKTPWYSASNDAPMSGQKPWVMVRLPEESAVRRVTVLGNRDPNFPTGYFVLAGKIEVLDSAGRVLVETAMKSKGEKHDFDFVLPGTAHGVKAVRFTATEDEKRSNCIGLSEIQVD